MVKCEAEAQLNAEAEYTQYSSTPSRAGAAGLRLRYKGVRKRSWGRWVSEIRVPHSREKVWLGSYATANQAARAYDAASILLRRQRRRPPPLNFPDCPPAELIVSTRFHPSRGFILGTSPRSVQATAAAAAATAAAADATSPSAPATTASSCSPSISRHEESASADQHLPSASDFQCPPPTSAPTGAGCGRSGGASWVADMLNLLSPKIRRSCLPDRCDVKPPPPLTVRNDALQQYPLPPPLSASIGSSNIDGLDQPL